MEEKEYREKLKKLEEINKELFQMILEQSKHIRELERLQKVRRVEKL